MYLNFNIVAGSIIYAYDFIGNAECKISKIAVIIKNHSNERLFTYALINMISTSNRDSLPCKFKQIFNIHIF